MTTATIELPGGLWIDGVRHREAVLRPLSGRDEVFLLEETADLPPAWRTTLLLARCLVRLGPWRPVPAEAVRGLTVGDREALLLHLRRLTLGDRLEGVLRCPALACGERMDLDLDVRDLLVPPAAEAAPWHEAVHEEGGTSWRARFRLPTGADQEEIAPFARADAEGAAWWMLRRCLMHLERDDGGPVEAIPRALADRIAGRMAELDPQAELTVRLTCPACGREFPLLFDAAAWLYRELAGGAANLWREVHRLALAYHWSEPEILRLTTGKRRLYLHLLAESPEEGAP